METHMLDARDIGLYITSKPVKTAQQVQAKQKA